MPNRRALMNPTRPANRRVLMLSAAFPPTGGAGVQRTAKFAKYLPRYGYDPIVWTARPFRNLPRDRSLRLELPDDIAIHTGAGGNLANWLAPITARSWHARRLAAALETLWIPDSLFPWALAGFMPLRRLIHTHRIDLIYSTYSPAANHLLALMLKLATGRPWVSDWRDLWTQDLWYQFRGGPRWRQRLDRALERAFLIRSDAVIATTEAQKRILADHLPADRAGNCHTLVNGFDAADFDAPDRGVHAAQPPPDRPSDPFVIAHVGRFTRDRVKSAMIDGFVRFAESLEHDRRRFELRIVGNVPDELAGEFRARGVNLSTTGYVAHPRAVAEMRAADVLLLQYPHLPGADTAVSGKLFEYFAAGRPVLMIGPPTSEARAIVRARSAGVCVDMDADRIAAALQGLWREWQTGSLPAGCDRDDLCAFTREALTARLADIFTETCARVASSPSTGRFTKSARRSQTARSDRRADRARLLPA